MRFLIILIYVKIGLCCCNIRHSNNTSKGKLFEVDEQFSNIQEDNSSDENHSESNTVKVKSLITKSYKKKMGTAVNKINRKSIKKPKQNKTNTEGKKKTKALSLNVNKVKTIKKTRKKPSEKSESDESKTTSKSKSEESGEPKYLLREGETLLDFSALAKIKSFDGLDQDSQDSSKIKVEMLAKDNPLLNWNCSSLSLAEETNISTGYLDKRICHVITHAEDNPDGGTQLLDDMRQYYCYLKHVNQLVVDQVKRGRVLMKHLVEEEPEFTQIGFDTDELTEHFCWVQEEADAFEHIMDGICYQWKCMVARLKHK